MVLPLTLDLWIVGDVLILTAAHATGSLGSFSITWWRPGAELIRGRCSGHHQPTRAVTVSLSMKTF